MLDDLEIEHFFYIGGNYSMDTIKKLSQYGERINSKIRFMGVPKTIDNDLAETDHTPGYGSAAKFIGTAMKEIIKDANVYGNPKRGKMRQIDAVGSSKNVVGIGVITTEGFGLVFLTCSINRKLFIKPF